MSATAPGSHGIISPTRLVGALLKYNGSANDRGVVLGAVGLSTPNNVIVQRLPR